MADVPPVPPVPPVPDTYITQFLRSLPDDLLDPTVGLHLDGDVCFEWYADPFHLVEAWISPNGKVGYAGLIGRHREYGEAPIGPDCPEPIVIMARMVRAGNREAP